MNRIVQFPDSWFDHSNPYRILVVDPDRTAAQALSRELGAQVKIERAATADTALQMLGLAPFDLMVLQLRLPLFSGADLAQKLRKILPDLAVIPTAPAEAKPETSEVIKLGYPPPVTLPDDETELIQRCREYLAAEDWYHQIDWLKMTLRKLYNYDQILSAAPEMAVVHERLTRIVNSKVPVLITGESGTGKELVARMIHTTGGLSRKPFIVVNCAAVPESLLESLFFGHEKGAFTGAVARSPGKFELAHTGTLFLDEIGEMSPALQAKLLRVLEYGEFERVGGSETLKVDVRLLTATNRDLEKRVTGGSFRADLFYRINVFPIHLPPLRERGEDIPLLAYYFLKNAGPRNKRQVRYIQTAALELLRRYPWPGNIRELENAVERALLLCDGIRLTPNDFPHIVDWCRSNGVEVLPMDDAPDSINVGDVNEMHTLREIEKEAIVKTLNACHGKIAEASRRLGISRNTLYRKIMEHEVKLPK